MVQNDLSAWISQLEASLPDFLARIQEGNRPGRYRPCDQGTTTIGRRAGLGFSCFALKTIFTLGLWETLHPRERAQWIAFIRSYQQDADSGGASAGEHAFIDPPILDVHPPLGLLQKLRRRVTPNTGPTLRDRVILAETKQAIATLAQVGATPRHPYMAFPKSPHALRQHMALYDWSQPWAAGGQVSGLVTLIAAQADALSNRVDVVGSRDVGRRFFDTLVDNETGGYFVGRRPPHKEFVNGAMKVLTALDWLEQPVHYPDRLIDACLASAPNSDGCSLVDAVYVLHRCGLQTDHRRQDVQTYCHDVVELIRRHAHVDGGLSFYVGRAQTKYYGALISEGLPESDIHGVCLLTWALAMILDILEDVDHPWKIIRP